MFLVPGTLELLDPTATNDYSIVWLAIGIILNPLFPITDKRRIIGVCALSVVFMLTALLAHFEPALSTLRFWLELFATSAALGVAYAKPQKTHLIQEQELA